MAQALWLNADILVPTISAILGGIAGGAVGFGVVKYQLKQTEFSFRIEQACSDINQIEEKAITFWMKPMAAEGQAVKAAILRSLMQRIGSNVALLAEAEWIVEEAVQDRVIALRRAVTGDSFDVKERFACPDRCHEITGAADALRVALRRSTRLLR